MGIWEAHNDAYNAINTCASEVYEMLQSEYGTGSWTERWQNKEIPTEISYQV
jgi:hypothetical protein